ncbi:hypothetical protein JL100_003070 [Skermanella mucosa]|uniref:hypothetical protein n=1 Tax=Skermanella mucosa TaxID=1789672 RepID=UPI00192ABF69|nr:hypothetical protein [Skermanella mucosa]UEM21763.1 hypothetical protein JL100_003070 [Skermanella mucosa]
MPPDPDPATDVPLPSPAGDEDAADVPDAGALAPFGDFAADLAVFAETLEDADAGVSLAVESMTIDLPVELEVLVDDDGRVRLGGEPPTQVTATSVMPVFHRMRITLGGAD